MENAIPRQEFHAPSDNDDDHPEDTYLSVHISVGIAQFHDFATGHGSLALPPGAWAGWLPRIEQGGSGDFWVDLKSIDEVFAQSPDFQKNLRGHLLYATNVKITSIETVDGAEKPPLITEYYLSRFVNAVCPVGPNGQSFPDWRADTIPFEMTRFEPRIGRGAVNTKMLQVIAPSGEEPTLIVTGQGGSLGTPSPFYSIGRDYIVYSPIGGPSTDSGEIQISRNYAPVGKILLAGTSITPRTWWIQRTQLVDWLKSLFPEPPRGNSHESMADEVVNGVASWNNSYWSQNAIQSTAAAPPTDAIQVWFRSLTGDKALGFTRIDPAPQGYYDDLTALKSGYERMNSLTYSYYLGRTLLKDLLLYPAPRILCDPYKVVEELGAREDPSKWPRVRDELVQTIVHEMEHAHCFRGHIIPGVGDGKEWGYYDVMQQGIDKEGYHFRIAESGHFLRSLLGVGWTSTDPELAIKMMSYDGAVSSGERRHHFTDRAVSKPWQNLVNRFDVTDDDNVTALDVLYVITWINSHPGDTSLPVAPAVAPPYYNVNGDNDITPLDVLETISYINAQYFGEGETEASGSENSTSDPDDMERPLPPLDRRGAVSGELLGGAAAAALIARSADSDASAARLHTRYQLAIDAVHRWLAFQPGKFASNPARIRAGVLRPTRLPPVGAPEAATDDSGVLALDEAFGSEFEWSGEGADRCEPLPDGPRRRDVGDVAAAIRQGRAPSVRKFYR